MAAGALAAAVLQFGDRPAAQRMEGSPRSALYGDWTLNRDQREGAPTFGGTDGASPRGGGRMGRPGGGGGFGGFGRGGGPRPGTGQMDREAMQRRRDLLAEVMTPPSRWVIAGGDKDLVVFTENDGRSVRHVANDKTERHQLTNGTIQVKTKWVGSELRQEIDLGPGMRAQRKFAVDGDRLVVSTELEGGGPFGRRPPVRWTFDRDAVR